MAAMPSLSPIFKLKVGALAAKRAFFKLKSGRNALTLPDL